MRVAAFFAIIAVLAGCASPPVAAPAPPALSEGRGGTSSGPRLLAIQAFVQPADYQDVSAFEGRLRGLFEDAADRDLMNDRTVVVLPEYLGTWLVAVDEGPAMFEKATLGDALTDLALAHLPEFLWFLSTSPAKDGAAHAAFSVKAERMAAVYDDVMSRLADDFDVTLVAGSIILPSPRLEDGRLVVTPGDPLQNVSVIYGSDGGRLGMARKAFPTADEQPFLSAADPATAAAVVDTPAGRLGVAVCADAWFPATYDRLVREGAEVLAVPTFHSQDDVWEAPWGGYSGHDAPNDVDLTDVGVLTEAEAWERYALAARAPTAGLRGAVSAPLRGSLWDLGDDGEAFLVDGDGFVRGSRVDGPAFFLLQLEDP